ncbi:hypothetical protein lerEdw1_009535, partial [Lerista edwardsae]
EEVDQLSCDAEMGHDVLESGDATPSSKRKSKFAGFGKIFKPWKWRKKKSSGKFKETSEVLERKISMRKSRDELIKRGVLLEDPEQDGDTSDKCGHTTLKNGHTIPIDCSGIVSLAHLEEEPGRRLSLKKAFPVEEPKKLQGSQGIDTYYLPKVLTAFKNSTKSWVEFSAGQHHTVCLDSEGAVYSLGRADYGMLGLGEGAKEKSTPTVIPGLPKSSSVACGERVGYAVTEDGCAFSWGMGSNLQLATGDDEDAWSPVQMSGQQLENRTILSVTSGGQHTVLLVKERKS